MPTGLEPCGSNAGTVTHILVLKKRRDRRRKMFFKSKVISGISLAVCLVLSATACTNAESSAASKTAMQSSQGDADEVFKSAESDEDMPDSSVSDDSDSDTLIAYFSATGNTKSISESIANITGGDLYEIVPADPYTSEDLDYGNSQSRTSVEMDDPECRPEISSEELSLEGYSTLYLGYPIWHGQAPRIMSTFVESYSFDDITVIPFCSSGGSGIGQSAVELSEISESGTWIEGERFSIGTPEAEIAAWINELQ